MRIATALYHTEEQVLTPLMPLMIGRYQRHVRTFGKQVIGVSGNSVAVS
jgi:hypothetical protein